jgi:hypothetical protein
MRRSGPSDRGGHAPPIGAPVCNSALTRMFDASPVGRASSSGAVQPQQPHEAGALSLAGKLEGVVDAGGAS